MPIAGGYYRLQTDGSNARSMCSARGRYVALVIPFSDTDGGSRNQHPFEPML
jgi:hypothetical protein